MEAGAYEWSLMANHATAARAPFGAAGARYHSGQLNSSAYMRKACVAGNSISTSPLFYGLDHDGLYRNLPFIGAIGDSLAQPEPDATT